MSDPIAALRAAVMAAVGQVVPGAELEPTLERPPKAEFGDYSTNAALLLAPLTEEKPRDVAVRLGSALEAELGDSLRAVEVAGPGFLNLFLEDSWFEHAAAAVAEAGGAWGSGVAAGRERRTQVEFVSANPTGPITVASARHAAFGDSLARILEFAGHPVQREYYVNDAGGQIRLFGLSLGARMTGEEIPEGGYQGDYVAEIADRLAEEGLDPADTDALSRRGVELMLESIGASLERFRVRFDRWFSERSLHESGALQEGIDRVSGSNLTYESAGALWMRTSELGDDKDRVVVRAGGEPTYFASDIAYHRDKLERGFELMINVLGADHHGYIARLQAAVSALGGDEDALEVEIMQLVNLLEGGERARMSKRRGEFTTLDELLDDIGVDAARFFLVQRSHDTPIDIDLEVARKRSNENPVFYVQYAHARICNIFRRAQQPPREPEDGVEAAAAEAEPDDGSLHASEKALALRLLELPAQVERAELRREPHSLGAWIREVAADFHAFYRDCPVLTAADPVRERRLELCDATRSVIATSLGLLGVGAPEEM
jgi:arginyl-tRNA synthetase